MQKSDLIYEFDADDLKTECKESHDSWKCSCGAEGKGNMKNCSKCGLGVKVEEWVCPECLNAVKKQVKLLLEFLENDFGINGGVFLNYSGFKGFHVHVRNEAFQNLSGSARIELLDYLTANEIDFEKLGFVFDGKRFVSSPVSGSFGWSKKILSLLTEFFEHADAEQVAGIGGISVKSASVLLDQKKSVLDGFAKGVFFSSIPSAKTSKFWHSILDYVVSNHKLAVDRQTSVDSFKIIRVPGTIHGSSGLVARAFSRKELSEFDGLSDAVVFGSQQVKLKSVIAPKFYLGKQWWGPFESDQVVLPEFVAVYLVARGNALLEEK